jgi:hypothetical protein
MWRNGRRNGLKIRSREKRGMGSTPIIGSVFIGKLPFLFKREISHSARKSVKKPAFFDTFLTLVLGLTQIHWTKLELKH